MSNEKDKIFQSGAFDGVMSDGGGKSINIHSSNARGVLVNKSLGVAAPPQVLQMEQAAQQMYQT